MFGAAGSIWLYTSQGRNIDWHGIDPQASHPTYAVYLHSDEWSFWRYTPISPEPMRQAHYAGKRRRLFLGLFWQSQWPRIIVVRQDSLPGYYCIGFETELRLPYWFIFTASSILPIFYILRRLRYAQHYTAPTRP